MFLALEIPLVTAFALEAGEAVSLVVLVAGEAVSLVALVAGEAVSLVVLVAGDAVSLVVLVAGDAVSLVLVAGEAVSLVRAGASLPNFWPGLVVCLAAGTLDLDRVGNLEGAGEDLLLLRLAGESSASLNNSIVYYFTYFSFT